MKRQEQISISGSPRLMEGNGKITSRRATYNSSQYLNYEKTSRNSKYFRRTEVDLLIGDPTKAMTKLGWKPKYDLAGLVKEMVASDIEIFKKELLLKQNGYSVTKESEQFKL